MTILVFGATGTQGGPVARQLMRRVSPIRAIARSRRTALALTALGAEVVEADFRQPDSLAAAVKGVDAVFLQLPATVSAAELTDYARRALTAIAEAGAPHTVITTSGVVPDAPTGVAYVDAKLAIVDLAQRLTPHAVVLHPPIYLDNLAGPLRPAIDNGAIPYPIPADVPVAWLSAADAAAFAISALDQPSLAGQRFPLGGPTALTGPQLADTLSTALNRQLRYQAMPPSAFGDQLVPLLGEQSARQVAAFYEWTGTAGAHHLAPDLTATLRALPVPRTTAADWARQALN